MFPTAMKILDKLIMDRITEHAGSLVNRKQLGLCFGPFYTDSINSVEIIVAERVELRSWFTLLFDNLEIF